MPRLSWFALVSPCHKVVEANHPFRHAVAPTEKLSNEAQYYLRVLTKLKLKDERDNDDGSAAVLIPLVELLTYRKVSEMCSSVAELRYDCAPCSYCS